MRRSSDSISSTTMPAACSRNARSGLGARATISSTVSRIGVSEFLTSCAVLRANTCQLASCVEIHQTVAALLLELRGRAIKSFRGEADLIRCASHWARECGNYRPRGFSEPGSDL